MAEMCRTSVYRRGIKAAQLSRGRNASPVAQPRAQDAPPLGDVPSELSLSEAKDMRRTFVSSRDESLGSGCPQGEHVALGASFSSVEAGLR